MTSRNINLTLASSFGHRLTLTSGVPITTTDVVGASTLYLTQYNSSILYTYDGYSWTPHTVSEISLALSGLTSAKNYDVFVYSNSGTMTLELSAAWTTDTVRADSLTQQDGIWVKSSNTSRRWVGTLRTTSTTTTEDSAKKRFVWNSYNQTVKYCANPTETTDSWSYTAATIRQANGNTANQFEYVTGDSGTLVTARVGSLSASTSGAHTLIGIDSTTINSAQNTGYAQGAGAALEGVACYSGYPGLGYHFVTWLERGTGSGNTWYGDAGNPTFFQSGMTGEICPTNTSNISTGSASVNISAIGHRLSLTSGTPVTTTDVTNATTIYLTQHVSNKISLYNGTWIEFSTNEVSLALGTLTSGKNYDVFAYNNNGSVALELSAAWTTDVARADALARQDGVFVKSSDLSRRYVGTIRTTSTTTTEDSALRRFVWNKYNQSLRFMKVTEPTDSWASVNGVPTPRYVNNNSNNKVEYISGDAGTLVAARAQIVSSATTTGGVSCTGIGVDVSNAFSGIYGSSTIANTAGLACLDAGEFKGYPGLGYHFLSWLELSNVTTIIWYGDAGASYYQSGMFAEMLG